MNIFVGNLAFTTTDQELRACFEACNQDALRRQEPDRAALYSRLKLSGLDDAPCQVAVFADRATATGRPSASSLFRPR